MANKALCKNKTTAISILETIMEHTQSETQRTALKSVAEWISENDFGNIPDTPEKRRALALKIETDRRYDRNDNSRNGGKIKCIC